mmetsp:Transcript_162965/g.522577  ORF Transcript_162965/g.522577 Transcript_162965/m.522577 type:complete len:209 (+) Transcript_162965:403-1029(+)
MPSKARSQRKRMCRMARPTSCSAWSASWRPRPPPARVEQTKRKCCFGVAPPKAVAWVPLASSMRQTWRALWTASIACLRSQSTQEETVARALPEPRMVLTMPTAAGERDRIGATAGTAAVMTGTATAMARASRRSLQPPPPSEGSRTSSPGLGVRSSGPGSRRLDPRSSMCRRRRLPTSRRRGRRWSASLRRTCGRSRGLGGRVPRRR